ncbi:hypothetical protein [Sagittula sp. SSi028]|uniref:hypothetical protein n=1 Tax=Sagittula sp. SSi028 TaxID=3400636 RepID=UPI003AF5C143
MSDHVAWLYLYPDLQRRLVEGKARFLSITCDVLRDAGWRVVIRDDSPEELALAAERPGFALVRMIAPPAAGGLVFRRGYLKPFWHIERSAERWNWPVAQAAFDPGTVKKDKADHFYARLKRRTFADVTPHQGGYVLMPLQGKLNQQRGFQSMSPLEMVETVLNNDPRPLRITLHPRETYSEAELSALERLTQRHSHATVSLGGSDALLAGCDYVATQNSSVAFKGFLLGKPAALFARSDFHHIAACVHDLGAAEALRQAATMTPDFAAYLWWFLRGHAINEKRPDAALRIRQALARGGWPGLD